MGSTKFNDIKKLNDRLNKYMWACVVDDKLAPNNEDCWEDYRTITPRIFDKVKAGCCWDYCNYQADYFNKEFPDIHYSLYYIDSDTADGIESTNHTWMTFVYDGKLYVFESAWKVYKGIHEFGSEKEMLDWYVKNQFRKSKSGTPPYVIYRYKRPHKDNMKPEDFMLYIFKTGEMVRNVGGKYERYIKPMKNAGWKYIWTDHLYFYHMVPKGTDVSAGLLSPYGLAKIDKNLALKALDKYRNRMVGGWEIYPGRDPSSLTLDELISGLEKFRDKGGSRQIYFFRYPPDASLGPNMKKVLDGKDIYRIDLMDKELQKHIERIYWGSFGSFSGNKELTEEYYRTVTRKEYFKDYRDNPKPGVPLFAPIPHIGIVFKDGACPAKFIKRVEIVGEQMINSHDEMSAMMEVSCNDKKKPFLEKIVNETGYWPSWMNDDQIQYVQENGFNMEPVIEVSSFKAITLNEDSVNQWKNRYYGLRHIRTDDDHKGILLIDEAKKQVVGFVNINIPKKEIQGIEVNPEYRRMGIATMLLDKAKMLGATGLWVRDNNTKARALYTKTGWKESSKHNRMIYMTTESANESRGENMNMVTEASKPKDYKIKGQLLFKKLDATTIKRHSRSCPALKNAKIGPGIKSLVIIKLGGFGRTYREYVGEIAGYVTCNSKGEVLSRWVSLKAKNFGIDAKLDAFVKKPVIESRSCFVTRETPVNENIFDRFKTKYSDSDLLKENENYRSIIKRDGYGYWRSHGEPISNKIYNMSPEPTDANIRRDIYNKARALFPSILKAIKDKDFVKSVKLYHPSSDDVRNWIEKGTPITIAEWDLWKFSSKARTDVDGGVYYSDLMYLLMNDFNIRLGNRSFKLEQDGDWDDGVLYLMDRNIGDVFESVGVRPMHAGYNCFVTRKTPVNEWAFSFNKKKKKTEKKAYLPETGKPFPGTKKEYDTKYKYFLDCKNGTRFNTPEYKYELIVFPYTEEICINIAKHNMEDLDNIFYGADEDKRIANAKEFFEKNGGLGVLIDTDSMGYMYAPKLNKWFEYDHEQTPQVNPNKPIRFSKIVASARNSYNDFMQDYPIHESYTPTMEAAAGTFKPIFVVFKRVLDDTFHTLVTKVTKSYWAHAAISFDSSLRRMYSFTVSHDGFTTESIKSYPEDSIIGVMCCSIPKPQFDKMMDTLRNYGRIADKTSYAYRNFIAALTKHPMDNSLSMVCSNFVDYMLKIGDISPTKMAYSVIHPGRLFRSMSKKRTKFHMIFKGKVTEYNPGVANMMVNKLLTNSSTTSESYYPRSSVFYTHSINEDYSLTQPVNTMRLHRKHVHRHATNGKNGKRIVSQEGYEFTDWF